MLVWREAYERKIDERALLEIERDAPRLIEQFLDDRRLLARLQPAQVIFVRRRDRALRDDLNRRRHPGQALKDRAQDFISLDDALKRRAEDVRPERAFDLNRRRHPGQALKDRAQDFISLDDALKRRAEDVRPERAFDQNRAARAI